MSMLLFKGKSFVQNHHLSVKYHQLVPKKNKSLTGKVSLNDNLIIHGDNLKALKALLPTYAGKVKCIYIDPPYNTGNEKWIYNDNVNSPMIQEWLGRVVNKEDLTRHDKWFCMMMPRLKLLRELLREDGVIFVSIGDDELHNLISLLNEVFFESNYVSTLVWKCRGGGGSDSKYFAKDHEYIIVYGNNTENLGRFYIEFTDEEKKRYSLKDKKGIYMLKTLERPERLGSRPNLQYPIKCSDGSILEWKRSDYKYTWVVEKTKFGEMLSEGLVEFKKSKKGWMVYRKNYLVLFKDSEYQRKKKPRSILYNIALTSDGTKEIAQIFGDPSVFDYPKPLALLKHLLKITTDKNSIVLDSFSGSGTTAHAVLELNKEDDGNRKFILVECEDYADKITAERVRRVIKGVKRAKDEKLRNGLDGTFSYFELGDPIEMESILEGDKLPSFLELARYVFYTATGEEFDPKQVDKKMRFIGESKEYKVYLFYKPDMDYLKSTALTLDRAKELGPYQGKKRLVFAPSKYLDPYFLLEYQIDYCQLPFEIYKLKE